MKEKIDKVLLNIAIFFSTYITTRGNQKPIGAGKDEYGQ
jgi:hypothetical protein